MSISFHPRAIGRRILQITALFILVTERAAESRPIDTERIETHFSEPTIEAKAEPKTEPRRYRMMTVDQTTLANLTKPAAGEVSAPTIFKLNRVDARRVRVGDQLVAPETSAEFLDLAPFPREIERLRETPKILLVSIRVQAFGAYEFGRLVQWGPVSTGKRTTSTPSRAYYANWKAKSTNSSIDSSWLLRWYVNLDNASGISLHQYDLPGYPASHGCVRLQTDDAKWLHDWLQGWTLSEDGKRVITRGSPVIVFGKYEYGALPPWKQLADDPCAASVHPFEIESALPDEIGGGPQNPISGTLASAGSAQRLLGIVGVQPGRSGS
jgi:hypothetical protein